MAQPTYVYMATRHDFDEVVEAPLREGDPWEYVESTPIIRVQRLQTVPSPPTYGETDTDGTELVSNRDVLVLCVTWRRRV